ncbi:MAG: FAD-binding oxidoreductase [Pseudonocardia sp.]
MSPDTSTEVSTDLGDELAHRVAGTVLTPADAEYGEAVRIWNGMIVKRPALVVRPARGRQAAEDVSAAVQLAGRHGLPVSVRSGGHNIAGTALADGGVTVDLSRLRDVHVDPELRTATVGAGCRLGDVDRETQRHGLAVPLGFVSRVGVAGLALGGGLGYLTRRFGWTVDNLLEVQIVTADGAVRRAAADEHPDLFWAVRGAGANLGVVTRLTFRLHPVGPLIHGGLIAWPFERAAEVLRAYRRLTATAPRELAVWCVLLVAPPAPFVPAPWHGRKLCAMAVCDSGPPERAPQALASLRAIPDPVFDLVEPMPYTAVQSYLDDTEPDGMHYYWRTEYLPGLDDGLLDTLTAMFTSCPMPLGELGLLHIGGALNERAEDDGAVGNRDARFVVGVKGMWHADDPGAERYRAWVRDAGDLVRPFGTGRTYVNFQTDDEGDLRARATYGANLPRLIAVKRRYDPGNVFRSNRNIAPDDAAGPVTGVRPRNS